MARKVSPSLSEPTPVVRSNPDLFGEDLVPLAWEAVGAGMAEFADSKIAAPVVAQLVPGAAGGSTAKLVDALTTAGSGWVIGEGVGMVSRVVGNRIRRGGVLLGLAKVMSAFIPGFALTASFPSIPGVGGVQIPAPAKSNGNGNGATTPAPRLTAPLGVGSTGL